MIRRLPGARSRARRRPQTAQLIARSSGTIAGDVRVMAGVWSPERKNSRDIDIYLPPSYEQSSRRYPVIYMHDGQNLFDDATSYAGEWRVDETMEELSRSGLEAIVVGIPNMQQQRADEYSPFPDARLGIAGRGDQYVAFLLDTLKPLIDRELRTQPDAAATGTAGSSMGGLISLYAFFARPGAFGFAGLMSPALWPGERAIFSYLDKAPHVPGRLYMDIGTAELPGAVNDTRRLESLLGHKGYGSAQLRYVEEEGAGHHESAWARRFPGMIRFLLGHAGDAADQKAGPSA